MSCFVLAAAFYGVFTVNRWTFSIFLFLQARAVLSCAAVVLLLPPASHMSCCAPVSGAHMFRSR